MRLLIQNCRLVDPVAGIGGVMDVLVEKGRVAMIGNRLQVEDAQIIPANGLTLSAGLVDMHVHLREPGFTHKETVATGAAAAVKGGFTSVACMPNTRPAIDSPDTVNLVLNRAREANLAHVWPIGAVSMGQKGEDLTDATALKEAGAVALSDDGVPVQSANLMRDALIKAKRAGLVVLSHCEDADMVKNYAVNEGRVSRKLNLPGRPAIAEELMVVRDCMLAHETGAPVHICHVSTLGSVEAIRYFKHQGVAVTAETCPQYFTLTEDEVLRQGAMARVNPPLRTEADVEAIRQGLKDGTIDVIATDHAPHAAEEKARPLPDAPSGMVGLETALAVTLTSLYHTGFMSLSDILRKMTYNPARILGQLAGHLCLGAEADLVLFDPDQVWTVDPGSFVSMGRNTPFGGMKVRGRVKYTIVGGQIAYQDKEGA